MQSYRSALDGVPALEFLFLKRKSAEMMRIRILDRECIITACAKKLRTVLGKRSAHGIQRNDSKWYPDARGFYYAVQVSLLQRKLKKYLCAHVEPYSFTRVEQIPIAVAHQTAFFAFAVQEDIFNIIEVIQASVYMQVISFETPGLRALCNSRTKAVFIVP